MPDGGRDMIKALSVGIAGAGIGGLATAALLAARGAEVTLFDQFDAPRPVGSGLVIQPVGAWVLEEAGAAQAARALGQPIDRMSGREVERNRVVLDVSYARPSGATAFGPDHGLAIHRASLFQALWDAAQAAGVQVVTSAPVARSETDVQGRWLIRDEGTRDGPFDVVVDALGAASPLSPLQGSPLPYGAIWGTVPWPDAAEVPQTELSQRYYRASRMAGILPIGRFPGKDTAQAAVFWSLPAGAYEAWRAQPLAEWQAQATALWPAMTPFLDQVTSHDDMTMARYSHGTLAWPVTERLAHIGDAAHRASPQLGQGANMALLDAFGLVRALSEGRDIDQALTLYAKSRRWHVRIYQTMSWAFTPQYQSDSRLLPWLRDWMLMPLSRTPPLPRVLSWLVSGDMLPPVAGQPYPGGLPQRLPPGKEPG